MSKLFIYCELAGDGLDIHEIRNWQERTPFNDWMVDSCREQDEELVRWAEKAVPGQYMEHRRGPCFCVHGADTAPLDARIDAFLEDNLPTARDVEMLKRQIEELRGVIAWVFTGDPNKAVCGDGKRLARTANGWWPWETYVEHVKHMAGELDSMQAQHLGVPECVVSAMSGDLWAPHRSHD